MPRPSSAPQPKPRSASPRLKSPRVPPRLVVRSSDIHAAGCISLDPIRKGDIIAEYDGPRIPKAVADERYGGRPVTYLFGFGEEDFVIDGFSTAMFINHSCAANCETEEQDERIFIRALHDIAAGEELVYDYHLYDSDLSDEAPCFCGAPHCRGTMYSEAELARRAKLLKRKR
ncbi:MAG: SET domain-containing protein [Janthinobacterium lividum]